MKKIALFALIAILSISVFPVTAHEGREVGDYVIVLGWIEEPAYAGVYNGLEFTVEHHDTGELIKGLAETLQVEVQFGPASKTLVITESFDQPGHYMARLTPTRPGDYTFHLTGTIEETEVDEIFSSADGEFSTIEPASDLLFPDSTDILTELQALRAEIEALKAEIEALKGK